MDDEFQADLNHLNIWTLLFAAHVEVRFGACCAAPELLHPLRAPGWLTQDEAYCGGRWEEGRVAEPVDADAMQRLLDAVQSACSDTIMQIAPRVLRAANRGGLTPVHVPSYDRAD